MPTDAKQAALVLVNEALAALEYEPLEITEADVNRAAEQRADGRL